MTAKKLILICLALVLTAGAARGAAAAPVDLDKLYGPRIDRLCMMIITNQDAQVLAAENGILDILGDVTRPSDIERLAGSPNLEMSMARGSNVFFLFMNNGAEPWNNAAVRGAAAQSIDRGNIVRMFFSGYSEPVNSWLPPVSPWVLPDEGRNRFDPPGARELLRKAGYTWNLTGSLIAPDGKAVEKIKLLTPLARVAPTTAEVAERIADSLAAVGFRVEVEPMDFAAMISKLDKKDYSLAVMAWAMSGSPLSLYHFFHSETDVEAGYNVSSTRDPRLDAALHAVKFAKNKAEAERASIASQRLLAEVVPIVPIYSRLSVAAVSKLWKNVLTTPGMSADNMWTILAAEPRAGKNRALNMLLAEEPRNLNPLVASSAYSWQVLGLIYESMVGSDPWTREDRPSLANSWRVGTETVAGTERTVLEFELRRDLFWNDGKKFTAHDVKATIDFIRKNKPPRFYSSAEEVASVTVSGDYSLTVRMNGVSYWQFDAIGGLPCLPAHVLDKITDWQSWDPTDRSGKSGPYGLVGTGPFMFEEYRAGEYLMMVKNPRFRLLKNERREGEVWGR